MVLKSSRSARFKQAQGFTLIELIIVIVVLGVISAIASVFIKPAIDAYLATIRRAELSDTADTATRRIARDVRTALPNSLRTSSNHQCLEFIPTKTGGRYRTAPDAAGNGDALDFNALDESFDMLGNNSLLPVNQRIVVGDVIAIYNLGIAEADAYREDNTAAVVSVSQGLGVPVETRIAIKSKKFPLASASNRFQVIPGEEKVVAYVCSAGNLHRTSSIAFSSSCPATGPILARQVSACNFDYSGPDLQRNALVRIVLQLSQADETVSLLHEIHVNNTP